MLVHLSKNLSRSRLASAQLMKLKRWRELAENLVHNNTSSAASLIRKLYLQYLFEFECAFERGGIDARPIIAQIEAATEDKRLKSEEARRRKREQRDREHTDHVSSDATSAPAATAPQSQSGDDAAAPSTAAAAAAVRLRAAALFTYLHND